MPVTTASPQDTYDHMIGSGALSFEWWHDCTTTGETQGDVSPEWTASVTADDGEDGEKTVTFGHKDVLKAARTVISSPPEYASATLVQACKHLVFNADEADLDAAVADELLQLIVLGEIVFG